MKEFDPVSQGPPPCRPTLCLAASASFDCGHRSTVNSRMGSKAPQPRSAAPTDGIGYDATANVVVYHKWSHHCFPSSLSTSTIQHKRAEAVGTFSSPLIFQSESIFLAVLLPETFIFQTRTQDTQQFSIFRVLDPYTNELRPCLLMRN